MPVDETSPLRFTVTLRGPRIVYGDGVAETHLVAELDQLEATRVLVLASDREHDAQQALLATIADRTVGHFAKVRRHVPAGVAAAATSLARAVDANCLLSIGGGSAVGTAKAVALETGLPIVAIPSTYAGSEYTPIYGITESGRKRTGRSEHVLPSTVLLDPSTTRDLPLDLTQCSAVNALAHCVSGMFAAGRSPVTDLLAAEGARLIARGLRSLSLAGENDSARGDLTLGSYLAGTVLAHAGTSAHHTICHILGGALDLPHAETHTAILPAAAGFLQEQDPAAAAKLAAALGATTLRRGITDLLTDIDGIVRLRDIGLGEGDLPTATDLLVGGEDHGVAGMNHLRASQLLADAW